MISNHFTAELCKIGAARHLAVEALTGGALGTLAGLAYTKGQDPDDRRAGAIGGAALGAALVPGASGIAREVRRYLARRAYAASPAGKNLMDKSLDDRVYDRRNLIKKQLKDLQGQLGMYASENKGHLDRAAQFHPHILREGRDIHKQQANIDKIDEALRAWGNASSQKSIGELKANRVKAGLAKNRAEIGRDFAVHERSEALRRYGQGLSDLQAESYRKSKRKDRVQEILDRRKKRRQGVIAGIDKKYDKYFGIFG
jgi:hypothetical protein